MGIDASIALQGKLPQFDNPLDLYSKVAQIQNFQNQNRLADLTFGEKQREVEQGNALSRAYQGALGADGTINRNKLYSSMAENNLGAKIPGIQKGFADQDKSAGEAKETQGKISAQDFKLRQDKYRVVTQNLASLLSDPDLSYDKVVANAERGVADGHVDQQTIAESLRTMPRDPVALRAHLQQGLFSVLSADQQLLAMQPKTDFKDTGGALIGIQGNPNMPGYGKPVQGAQINKTMTPGEIAADGRGRTANNLKAEENRINRAGIVGKRTQDVEMKLQDDYRAESKGWSETSTSMKKILGAIETADKNPGSALAAGTAFMKILDPNSVVRESELGMALNASGWFDRATNIANTIQSGKVMTATQKSNLKAASENLFEEAKAAQLEVDAAYRKRATDYGADPARIIVDRGQNIKRPAAGGAPKAGNVNARGWALHTDANGNKAYVSPDGKQFQEVK